MYCSYCGAANGDAVISYPHKCFGCARIHYKNPIPVVVGLPRVFTDPKNISAYGILLVRRSKNQTWALPGGFVDTNDVNWQEALSREIKEETGLIYPPKWRLEGVETASDRNILIFASSDIAVSFISNTPPPNPETDAIRIAYHPEELAFQTHTKMLKRYLDD